MDAQTLLVIALFGAALAYLGRRLWRTFFSKQPVGCAKGCGGTCGAALDVDALERTIAARRSVR